MTRKVIIVDDSKTSRMFIKQALEIAGMPTVTFVEAGHGIEALRQIHADPEIELMVTDINMPEMGGLELIAALRAGERGKTLPILVISSTQSEERAAKLRALGIEHVIAKPLKMPRLMQALLEMGWRSA